MSEEELKNLQSLHYEHLQREEARRASEVSQDSQMLQTKAINLHLKSCADVYRDFYIRWGVFPSEQPVDCSMIVKVPVSAQVRQEYITAFEARNGVVNSSQATYEKAKKVVETTNIVLRYRGQSQQVKLTLVSGNPRRNDFASGCDAEYCYKLSIGSDIALKK